MVWCLFPLLVGQTSHASYYHHHHHVASSNGGSTLVIQKNDTFNDAIGFHPHSDGRKVIDSIKVGGRPCIPDRHRSDALGGSWVACTVPPLRAGKHDVKIHHSATSSTTTTAVTVRESATAAVLGFGTVNGAITLVVGDIIPILV